MEVLSHHLNLNNKFIYGVTTMPDGSKTDNNKKLESKAAKILAEVKDGGMDAKVGLAAIDGLMASVDMSAPGAGKLMDKLQSTKESIVKAAEEKASKTSAPKEKEEEKKEEVLLSDKELDDFLKEAQEMNARIEAALKRFEEGKQTKEDFIFIEETLKDEKKLKRIKLAQKTLEKKTKEFLENKDELTKVHGQKWAAKQEEELSKKTETTQKLAKGIEQLAAKAEKEIKVEERSPSSTKIAGPESILERKKRLQNAKNPETALKFDSIRQTFSSKISEETKPSPDFVSKNTKNKSSGMER
jgi:hypothetical protein